MSDLRFAMICASNVNRSVAAHALLEEHGFDVCLSLSINIRIYIVL